MREGDEQRGLRRGQAGGFLTEVGQRRGAQPFKIAAHGREVEVEIEDLRLAQPPFQREGEADLAFTYGEERDQRHLFYSLFRAPPYALVPLDDPLADRADVTLAELVERPMVLLDLPGARKYFMELFDAEGLVPQIAHTSRSSEIVRALVSSGFGFSLLNIRPLGYSQDESPYRVLPLRGDHRHPDFGIVTMAETEQPTIVQAFIENCLDLRQEGAFASLIVE